MTDEPATRTLTYRQLADALGISLRAAEARARRRIRQGQWRAIKGNDGTARFVIPLAELEAERIPTAGDTRPHAKGTTEGDTHPHAPDLAELQAVLARLTEQTATELREARALADQRAAELAELRERTARTEAERDHARTERERAEQEAGKAQAELAAWMAGGPLARAFRALLYHRP